MTVVKSLEVFSKSTFYGIDYFNMHETVNDCLMVFEIYAQILVKYIKREGKLQAKY